MKAFPYNAADLEVSIERLTALADLEAEGSSPLRIPGADLWNLRVVLLEVGRLRRLEHDLEVDRQIVTGTGDTTPEGILLDDQYRRGEALDAALKLASQTVALGAAVGAEDVVAIARTFLAYLEGTTSEARP